MKVVDASAIIDLLALTPNAATIVRHLEDDLFAPDLLVSEVLGTFRRMAFSGELDARTTDELVLQFIDADIEFMPVWPYTTTMWRWRHRITMLDATYVALAADLGCPLLTTDHRLARAAAGIVPVITL
jgi:predicted nucleic acid-binding protein